MSQLTIEERLEKEKRSMDKFLYEKDVEDLIIEIRSLKRISHCKETRNHVCVFVFLSIF
jgi:hypothetical protein